jgi:hypothetical protein
MYVHDQWMNQPGRLVIRLMWRKLRRTMERTCANPHAVLLHWNPIIYTISFSSLLTFHIYISTDNVLIVHDHIIDTKRSRPPYARPYLLRKPCSRIDWVSEIHFGIVIVVEHRFMFSPSPVPYRTPRSWRSELKLQRFIFHPSSALTTT